MISTKYYRSDVERIEPARKAAWCAALRSDQFVQGEGALKRYDADENGENEIITHCCLGVYCEVNPDLYVELGETPGVFGRRHHPRPVGSRGTVPGGFEGNFTLFTTKAPNEKDYNRVTTWGLVTTWCLTDLNDSGQFTFAQIADCIEYFL